MSELSNDQKREVILAATNAAGPGASDAKVVGEISRILSFFEDGSPAMRAFDRADERASKTTDVKGFVGEVIFVDLEGIAIGGKAASNRPIVFLRTEVSQHAPEGIEIVRLDRMDSHDAERVRSLANETLSLVGHTVGVTVAIEKTVNGLNARILRSIEDRGAGKPDIAGLTNERGWQLIDWEKGGKGTFAQIAPRLVRLSKFRASVPA